MGTLGVHRESDQIPLVDADHGGAGAQGQFGFGLVVHLDQGAEAHLAAKLQQFSQLPGGQRGHDKQHGIGTHEAGVAHVGGTDGEILTQHRQFHGHARLDQVAGRARKKLTIGQH